MDDIIRTVRFARAGDRVFLDTGEHVLAVWELPAFSPRREAAGGDGRILAPMSGRVVALYIKPGDTVARGQSLLAIEAMKMQNQILADIDGTVAEVLVAEGDQVQPRKLLVRLGPVGPDGGVGGVGGIGGVGGADGIKTK